jgi:hypothetical protein
MEVDEIIEQGLIVERSKSFFVSNRKSTVFQMDHSVLNSFSDFSSPQLMVGENCFHHATTLIEINQFGANIQCCAHNNNM